MLCNITDDSLPHYLLTYLNFLHIGVMAELDLIPFITDKDLNERDPDLDSLLTDRTAGI